MSRIAPCLPGISQCGSLLGVAGAEAGGVGVPVPECASPGGRTQTFGACRPGLWPGALGPLDTTDRCLAGPGCNQTQRSCRNREAGLYLRMRVQDRRLTAPPPGRGAGSRPPAPAKGKPS